MGDSILLWNKLNEIEGKLDFIMEYLQNTSREETDEEYDEMEKEYEESEEEPTRTGLKIEPKR